MQQPTIVHIATAGRWVHQHGIQNWRVWSRTSAARGLYHKHVQVVYTITGLERWNGDIDLYIYHMQCFMSHQVDCAEICWLLQLKHIQ